MTILAGLSHHQQHLHFVERFSGPVAVPFSFFADQKRWIRFWGVPGRRTTDSPRVGQPDGPGAVRTIGLGPLVIRERIIDLQPGQRLAYTCLRGPIRRHVGVLTFAEQADGVQLSYEIQFEPRMPGTGAAIAAGIRHGWWRGLQRFSRDLGWTSSDL